MYRCNDCGCVFFTPTREYDTVDEVHVEVCPECSSDDYVDDACEDEDSFDESDYEFDKG